LGASRMSTQHEYLTYVDDQGRVETYEEHVLAMFSEWNKIRQRIISPLIRLYDCSSEHADFFIKSIILMHDLGKLTDIYQEYLSKRKPGTEGPLDYRHEFVSAIWHFCTFKDVYQEKFGEIYKNILSEAMAAIITHHEYWAQWRTKNYRPDYIMSHLNKWFKEKITLVSGSGELIFHMAENLIRTRIQMTEQILIKKEAYEALRVMNNHIDRKGAVAHKVAIRATALLQILCICDIRAAQRRGEKSSPYIKEVCEGGLLG